MHENTIDRVHRLAGLLIYDLELPDSVRHPVRFFSVQDILRAAGEIQSEIPEFTLPSFPIQLPSKHSPACDCRFCVTDLLDTRVLKRPLP